MSMKIQALVNGIFSIFTGRGSESMNLLKLELKSCWKRAELHFIVNFMLIISIASFLIECIPFYGMNLSFVRSAAESTLIQGTYASMLRTTLLIILPLICSLIYADSFYIDYKTGVYKSIITRTDKRKYIMIKSIVVFISTFFVFFITLFVNLVLCLIVFPKYGFDNIYSLPPYDIGVQNYNSMYLFDFLRIQAPFFYNIVSVVIISMFAGLISVLTYSVYFMFLSKNRIVGTMVVFICYILSNIAFPVLGFPNLSLYEQIKPNHIGHFYQIVTWMIVLFILSICFIVSKGMKREWDFED